jgi:N-acetylneuraminic acid mutarotase
MEKGISAVIASILLLLIVILIVSLASFFILRTTQTATTATEQHSAAVLDCSGAQMSIENVYIDEQAGTAEVAFRNKGRKAETLLHAEFTNVYGARSENITQGNITVQPNALGTVDFAGYNYTWRNVTTAGAAEVGYSGFAAWDTLNSRMLIFAGVKDDGVDFSYPNDMWAYAPAAGTWVNLSTSNNPPPRVSFGEPAVWDTVRNQFIIFGGSDSETGFILNETWVFDSATSTWINRTNSVAPPRRSSYAAAWNGTHMLVFGGGTGLESLNELWSYEPGSNTWANITPTGLNPPRSAAASAAWDEAGRRLIVFGGLPTPTTATSETWVYSPAANAWANTTPAFSPSRRGNAVSAWNDRDGEMIVAWGLNPQSAVVYNDTWAYDPAANTWRSIAESHDTISNAMWAWDSSRAKLIVYGGLGSSNILNGVTRELGKEPIQCGTFSKVRALFSCSSVEYAAKPAGC